MPASLAPLALTLTLDEVVADAHLHAQFLTYLSAADKKDFARLLFLVSVDEFKKLLRSPSAARDHAHIAHAGGDLAAGDLAASISHGEEEDEEDEAESRRAKRVLYASKIIAKFMSKDSFLDIASENLHILNKSVWSFGRFLRNDLMLYSGLAAKQDLFQDAEVAVKRALQPRFEQFACTQEFADLVANTRITFTGSSEEDDEDEEDDDPSDEQQQQHAQATAQEDKHSEPEASTASEYSPREVSFEPLSTRSTSSRTLSPSGMSTPRRARRSATSFLTLERVLANRRLCSVFWVFLFKERTHQQLSLWMDYQYHLIPLLEAFIEAAKEDISLDSAANDEAEDSSEEDRGLLDEEATEPPAHHPGELIEQLLTMGSRISSKYLASTASTPVHFVSDADQTMLNDYDLLVMSCLEAGSFSLTDAEVLLRTVKRISEAIEYDLKVNHFVRFMASDSFKSLVASYQSRLLSPSGSLRDLSASPSPNISRSPHSGANSRDARGGNGSTNSDSSMTTLEELFHCMNVSSHQPLRDRSKKFALRDLFQAQMRGEPQSKSLISSVISFRLDTTARDDPEMVTQVLHTLASKESDMYHHHSIPDHVEAFFCPGGAEVVRSKARPEPKLFHVTIGTSEKPFYGACLTRYVAQEDDRLLGPLELALRETEGMEVFVPVGLCIISRYPILDTLKRRLDALHSSLHDDEEYLRDPHWMPSARQMADLVAPFDFSVATGVDGRLSSLETYRDFSMEELFNCLSIENIVALVTSLLLERQIVLVSSRYSVLTCVGETLRALVSPLSWSHVFAPILPKSMMECLQCPTPYLFGVHASYRRELFDMLAREGSCDGIVVADLDGNTLSAHVRPQLPDAVRLPLVSGLLQLLKPKVYFSDYVPMCHYLSSAQSTSREFPERHVRACFAAAVADILRRLDEFRFVLSDDFDYVVVFDREGFLHHLPASEKQFFRCFLETQLFSHEIAQVS